MMVNSNHERSTILDIEGKCAFSVEIDGHLSYSCELDGVKPLVDRSHACGIKFGLWIEPDNAAKRLC